MTTMLDALAGLNGKPLAGLSPGQVRDQPTPADAVKQIMAERGIAAEPAPEISVKTIGIPGPYGQIPLHIYTPQAEGSFPVVVYFHGGGFVIADTKVYDASVHALVSGARTVRVSVDYLLAPEQKFPVAPEEAYAAYSWVLSYAQEINGDAKRMAVAGESAGGNLAGVVSLMARIKRQPLPIHTLLIYPVVDNNLQHSSCLQNAHAKPLDVAMRIRSIFASSAESDRVTGRFPQVGPRTLRHDARQMARRCGLRTAHPVDDRRHRRVQIQIPF